MRTPFFTQPGRELQSAMMKRSHCESQSSIQILAGDDRRSIINMAESQRRGRKNLD